jgi:ABC-2 type transport system permease protein
MTLLNHELKMNLKSLIIWTGCVGLLCFGCILLYASVQDSLQGMEDTWANMGALSTAVGMDKMSITSMKGYYATEICLMHGLGGAFFAALFGSSLLSKEEAGHTSEFLNVFPISRRAIVLEKYGAFVINIVIFNVICALLYAIGFIMMGEEIPMPDFILYHEIQILMQIEIGSICFMISAFTRKNLMGAGFGIAIIFYAMDLMGRIIPAIKNIKYITPFYYSNGADIFSTGEVDGVMLGIGIAITAVCVIVATLKYQSKDLMA